MPRPEDIAWKFVVRLDNKRWRCPYCHKGSSGSVTRVKSHFLKHPKEGIAYCTKVPEHIRTLMELLLNHEVHNKDDIAWKFVNRLGENRWRCHHCSVEFSGDLRGVKGHLLKVPNEGISICTEVPDHVGMLMQSLLNEVAEGGSIEAPGQSPLEPESCGMSPGICEFVGNLLMPPQGATNISNINEQVNFGFTCQPSQAEHHFPQSSTVLSLVQNGHGESTSCSTEALGENVLYFLASPHQPPCSFLSPRPDEMPMNGQQIPTGTSSFQYNQLPATGKSHCLQDSDQHSQLQTPMDIVSSIAPQHTSDSHIIDAPKANSQVPEMATNTTGSLSSQDVNRCSPTMNLWSIYANDEEIRNLKRKVEELDDKEAVIKEQMEIESAASSVRKKPRILVERWLKETERARNSFQIIGQANAETLPLKEQVETLTRETEELVKQTLPQTLLVEERDAKGVKFFEQKLAGEAVHRNIELIWHRLKENHACKLGIYGMGGVGKTTIMMRIHNRLLKDATFDGVGFITVSKDLSIYKLQSDIAKSLNLDIMKNDDENKRAAMLSEHLERKKNCLLILDDLWEYLDLEEVGIPVSTHGFKFVLTTRSFDVCCQMQCQQKIKIEPLSQEEAKSLFLDKLAPEMPLNLEIEAIVESIVKECAGLPMGVIVMATSMRGVTDAFQWRDFLTKLKESSMGQTSLEKKLLMKLKVSYDRLGNPNIQQCFLSCALYPEDELIDESELIEFFIDQGLIDELNTKKEQCDRGLSILKTLGNVCLLEYNQGRVKMHDLLRDTALHIMSAISIVKAGKGLKRIPPKEYWTDALEKVSLMKNNISEFPLNLSPNCPKLSTLLLDNGLSRDAVIPDYFFKNLRGLKVLNLSGYNMTELPNSISDLVNLRVLLLIKCMELCYIPCLGKLTSLRKLDVSNCVSLEVLKGLKKLVNLRYLDLTGTFIERLPKGTLKRLRNLQCLKVGAVNEEDITKLGALETFECCPENVDDFNMCVRGIEQSVNPRYYCLVMHEASMFEVKVSDDDAQFGNLGRSVNIWECDHAIVSVGGECTGIFILIPRDVQTMTMRKCSGITNLSSLGPLEFLGELEIEECENLGVLCGGQDEVIDIHDSFIPTPTPPLFHNLRVLNISYCSKLKYLFGHGFKSNLPHLQEIKIERCEEMVGIIAAVTSPPPHPLPFFPSLEEISIEYCDKMKRAVESEWMPHFPKLSKLKRIGVFECEKMEEIVYLSDEEISLTT